MGKHRNLIFEIIKDSSEHMTAEEIFMKAKKEQPSIAMGTVYRNLGLMTADGEIRRISMPDSPDRYDKSVSPHEHLICANCGKLSDVSVPDLKAYLAKQIDIEILAYELNLKYICNECKSQMVPEEV
ncbi:transcriptional repressor [Aminipila butyrica]|uniref:Transcriptional repressor n=1 Tax=Aminipila butyrica TaxID=433296 RepID=A0A858BWH1_9FIRM|nr:transcriptional repressor [Aminipila butyrica]QIB70283.1 transcriptional repressor [Aminipila butyrica]